MIIPARFNGPPDSGNGGYSAGVLADGADREVTLRLPPPLDTPLTVTGDDVHDPDGRLVAQLAPLDEIEVGVPPVSLATATEAATRYPGLIDHPFPTCYVCSPGRPDGLRVLAGPLPDGSTAAPWTVPADLTPATVWAALDCPGGWAVIGSGRPFVLGRIGVRIARLPEPGDVCVIRGACTLIEGRKARVLTTLYGPDGAELARARATWIRFGA
jgi:hypothetical protein